MVYFHAVNSVQHTAGLLGGCHVNFVWCSAFSELSVCNNNVEMAAVSMHEQNRVS
jgi:hypothetical protein